MVSCVLSHPSSASLHPVSHDLTPLIRGVQVPFVLYGIGGVGSELLKVIVASRSMHAVRYGLRFAAVGLCDSSGAVVPGGAERELQDTTIEAVISHKGSGKKLLNNAGRRCTLMITDEHVMNM